MTSCAGEVASSTCGPGTGDAAQLSRRSRQGDLSPRGHGVQAGRRRRDHHRTVDRGGVDAVAGVPAQRPQQATGGHAPGTVHARHVQQQGIRVDRQTPGGQRRQRRRCQSRPSDRGRDQRADQRLIKAARPGR
jgi:hypothetical protein